jgi:predicted PurR-regulated permease PerM
MSTTLNPEIAALRDKVEEHGKELAEMRGTVNQLNKIVSASVRQSIWQLIAVIVTLLVAIGGGLAYQTSAIDKRIEQMEKSSNMRFEMIEKQFEQVEKRVDQSEKNIIARFEDLKQEVRTQRK